MRSTRTEKEEIREMEITKKMMISLSSNKVMRKMKRERPVLSKFSRMWQRIFPLTWMKVSLRTRLQAPTIASR